MNIADMLGNCLINELQHGTMWARLEDFETVSHIRGITDDNSWGFSIVSAYMC